MRGVKPRDSSPFTIRIISFWAAPSRRRELCRTGELAAYARKRFLVTAGERWLGPVTSCTKASLDSPPPESVDKSGAPGGRGKHPRRRIAIWLAGVRSDKA